MEHENENGLDKNKTDIGFNEAKNNKAVDRGTKSKPVKVNKLFSPQKTIIVFQAQKNKSKIKTKFTS